MSTVPVPGGLIAVIWAPDLMVRPAALVPPKLTLVAPVKPWPVIMTLVPPSAGPLTGETPVMVISGPAVWVTAPGLGSGVAGAGCPG